MPTHEWRDGVLSTLMKQSLALNTPDKKWFVLDGPVDAFWIESLNTVLDDNKKLCLCNGEVIQLTEDMSFLFEVQDLCVASPATVSRCGMVWLEPSLIGIAPLVESWIQKTNRNKSLRHIHPYIPALYVLLRKFLQRSIEFVRTQMKEIVATTDANLVFSLLKILDCLFKPFLIKEGKPFLVSILTSALRFIIFGIRVPDYPCMRLKSLKDYVFHICLLITHMRSASV